MKTLPLLVEIGCEEIPARFLQDAERNLGEGLRSALADARLLVEADGAVATYSTPRRLVVHIPKVFASQPDKSEEIQGPPIKVAFDAQGNPTRAAESFAANNEARLEDLFRLTTSKGEYLALNRTTRGRTSTELLPDILRSAVLGLSFPKSMYWTAKSGPRFVRPIRWILALLGEGQAAQVIPFEIAGVNSGRVTYGHRAHGSRPLAVSSLRDYQGKLRRALVEVDPAKRREAVRNGIKVLLENSGTKILEDTELEDWIVNSTEWPHALLGSFEERFLHLPREILITVMRDHQKYFAVEDAAGSLQPRFVTILNVPGDPQGLIRNGHQRVLAARFTDAEFFWNADQKAPLSARRATLDRVTYEAKLGSYGDKVRRMEAIARELCGRIESQGKLSPAQTEHALRAVALAKCDLTTQMVQEFTELQGIVGGLYARAQGEPPEVAEAIYDQYLPQGIDDRSPRSVVGAVVSLADKIDTVVGGFAVGNAPTGSSDPFGLRRAGNGIIKVLLEYCLESSVMGSLFQAAVESVLRTRGGLPSRVGVPALETDLIEFFRERLRFYFETVKGFRYDSVRAVIAARWDPPMQALRRAEAIEKIRGSEDFLALSAAAKRIKNILSKSATASDWQPGEVNLGLVEPGPEAELCAAYQTVAVAVAKDAGASRYEDALLTIASLRPKVDLFFDKVLVMAPDPAIRQNRLRLLGKLDELFSSIAQLSEIAPGTALEPSGGAVKPGK